MTKREQLSARRRLAAEHVLRDRPVHDDHRGVGHREDVGRLDRREVPHVPRDDDERDEEQRLLPGRDHVERRSPHAEVPQLRHRGVVQDEPDDEDRDGDPGEAARANRRSPPASCRDRRCGRDPGRGLRGSAASGGRRRSRTPSRSSDRRDEPDASGSQWTTGSRVCTSTGKRRFGVVMKTRRPTRIASDTSFRWRSRPPTCSMTAFEKTMSNSPSAKGSAHASPCTYGISG